MLDSGVLFAVCLCLDGGIVLGRLLTSQVGKKGSGHGVLETQVVDKLKCLLVEPWHDIIVKDVDLEAVGVETDISQMVIGLLSEASEVVLSNLTGNDFSVSQLPVLLLLSSIAFELLELCELLLLGCLHSLDLLHVSGVHPVEVLLLFLHFSQLFFLKHLHSSHFKGLAAKHRKNGLDVVFKEEQLVILNKGLLVDTSLLRHEPGSLRALYLDLGLAANLIAWSLISELLDELISLNVDVLSALKRLRSSLVTGEELFTSSGTGLGLGLGSRLSIIKERVGIVLRRQNHGGISGASLDTFVIHDVLRVVIPKQRLVLMRYKMKLNHDAARHGFACWNEPLTLIELHHKGL